MPITIGANITSLRTQRQLGQTTEMLTRVFERLSSGQRINRASDDAAGLAIASALRADSRVYAQGLRNVNDGISLLAIAQGALSQLSDIVIRQRELAEQAANGTYGYKQRLSLDREADALVAEYNRIIQSTTFNGELVMDGTADAVRIQHGSGLQQSTLVAVGSEIGVAAGSGSFTAGQQLTPGNQVNGLTQGDFNGDGITDLVVQNGTYEMELYVGNADGSFSAKNILFDNNTTVFASYDVRSADLNGDGKLDLIFSTFSTLSVALGNGNGSFKLAVESGVSSGNGFELGDFNNDGRADVVDSGGFVNLGRGDGTFSAAGSIGAHASNDIAVTGDFNGDGNQDIAISVNATGVFEISLGNGNGSFKSAVSYATGANPYDLVTADVNNDGILDIISSSNSAAEINIRLGNGDGTFGARRSIAAVGTTGITTGDFNGDGFTDIIGSRFGTSAVTTLLGRGDGTFSDGPATAAGTWSYHILTGDYNRDGVTDIVYGNFSNALLEVKFGVQDPTGRRNNLMNRYDLTTRAGALEALERTNVHLERISREIAVLGASESRLGTVVQNLTTARENFMAAESRIMDADIAAESALLIRAKILQQAGAAVLANANQEPDLALSLLRS